VTGRVLALTTLAGVVLGVAYTLSPLSIWFVVAFALLCWTAATPLPADERRLVITLLVVAALLRVAVVAGLFLVTDHGSTPFGSLFGDEEYFKRRSLWLRSMALDVNISNADRVYATTEYSDTSYLYWLAIVQIVVGAAPYGVHLVSILLHLAGAVMLHGLVRRTFGAAPALVVLVLVLFLPTLFFWSVSALRESVHFLFTTTALRGAVEAAARQPVARRVGWALAAAVAVAGLRDLRAGSMMIVLASLVGGLAIAAIARRPRVLVAATVAAMVCIAVAGSLGLVQERLFTTVRANALNHQGHVFTPGVHYKLLEPKFYRERREDIMDDMTVAEATRYVARAIGAAVLMPLPTQAQTPLTRAYLPEHVVWLALAVLLPFGVWFGWRYHPAATAVLATYVMLMGLGIALRSGNVGTLIRHRSLIIPYVVCFGAVAVCHLLTRWQRRGQSGRGALHDPLERCV
jgi:hypothetical protein